MTENEEYISGDTQTKLIRRSVKGLFAVAWIVGTICIVVGINFNSRLLSVVGPLFAMGVYIGLCARGKYSTDLAPSKVGDSYYYLGFVLTLVSLVSSLMYLSTNDNININAVVGSFGAALSTTIIGLIARLFATTLTPSITTKREQLENELERAVHKFSAQIGSMTNSASTAIMSIVTDVDRINKELSAHYKKSAEEGADSFKRSIEGMSKKIEDIEITPDLISKPVDSALSDLIETIAIHKNSYSDMNTEIVSSNSKLSEQLSQSSTLIQGHIHSFEMSLAKIMDEQSESYKNSLEAITTSIFDSMGDVKDLKIEVNETLVSQLSSMTKEMDAILQSVSRTTPVVESVNHGFGEISGLIAKTSENVNAMFSTIDNVNKPLFQGAVELDKVKNTFEELIARIDKFNERLEETSNISAEVNSKLSAAATATSDASLLVAKDIREIYGDFARQIREIKKNSS